MEVIRSSTSLNSCLWTSTYNKVFLLSTVIITSRDTCRMSYRKERTRGRLAWASASVVVVPRQALEDTLVFSLLKVPQWIPWWVRLCYNSKCQRKRIFRMIIRVLICSWEEDLSNFHPATISPCQIRITLVETTSNKATNSSNSNNRSE